MDIMGILKIQVIQLFLIPELEEEEIEFETKMKEEAMKEWVLNNQGVIDDYLSKNP